MAPTLYLELDHDLQLGILPNRGAGRTLVMAIVLGNEKSSRSIL